MKGYTTNIEQDAIANDFFRRVIYTTEHCQLVLMSVPVGGEIGLETHDVDQFLRVEQGVGTVLLGGVEHHIEQGSAIIVPAGVQHNVLNTSATRELKLYTLYTPPHHRDGVVHQSKKDADMDMERFDGKTTES